MSVKTIAWIVALVIVAGLAILVGRRAGQHRDDELSSNQSVPLSEFPQVSETTIHLDDDGFPTGAVSTSSTSTLLSGSSGSNGNEPGEPEPADLFLSDEEQTMSQEPHQGSGKDSASLVNLQLQILNFRAVVDVSRRSLSRQKSNGA